MLAQAIHLVRPELQKLTGSLICGFARVLTGVRAIWQGCSPKAVQRVYFANHSSHGDFVLIWASLPADLRMITRPVAGSDYWLKGPIRRFLINDVFRAVLIDREKKDATEDPVAMMASALAAGDSLIIFPEGTRNMTDTLLPFKSGIFHLTRAYPNAEFVPVWIENINRVMPKGVLIPVPLLCSVTFGEPMMPSPEETKQAFLDRARAALIALAPPAA